MGIVLDLTLLLVDDVAAGHCGVGALLVLVWGAHLQTTNIIVIIVLNISISRYD